MGLLRGTLASSVSVLCAQGTPDLELTSHPNPFSKADKWGQRKEKGSKPRAVKGITRRGDNCSHYLELTPKPGLLPGGGWGHVANCMEMDGGAPSPRRHVRPGAITVPPGWIHCPPS